MSGGLQSNTYVDIMRFTTAMTKMIVAVIIVISANTDQGVMKWVLVTCKNIVSKIT